MKVYRYMSEEHLNLIRKIGFNISKDENTYELMYFKNGFNFAKYELSICTYLLLLAYIMLPKIKVAHFSKAIQKMLYLAKYTNIAIFYFDFVPKL